MIERSDMLNNQAIELAAVGNFGDAIACFKRALVIEKDNYLLWYNLGVTYRDFGDLNNAQNALAAAYKINPYNDDVVETYATICLSLGQHERSVALCEEGIDFSPLNTHLWNLLGVNYFQTERYEDAATCFEQAVFINPYYADALFNLRDTYSQLGNAAGQSECEKRLLELNEK